MTGLALDIFDTLTQKLGYYGDSANQDLVLREGSFRELKDFAAKEDARWEGVKYKKQYSDETYTPHIPILPYLEKEQPEFPFNGFIFRIEIV